MRYKENAAEGVYDISAVAGSMRYIVISSAA